MVGTAGLALGASLVACSVILGEQSLPCTSQADCSMYAGSRCDLTQQRCVAGDAVDTGTGSDSGFMPPPDSAPMDAPSSDAPADSTVTSDTSTPESGTSDVTTPDTGTMPDADVGTAPAIDWAKLTSFLESLYDSGHKLVMTKPASGSYLTSPDNALAQRAFFYLPTPDPTKSTAILDRLLAYKVCGCSVQAGHDGTINHQFDPLVKKGATIPLDPAGEVDGVPTDTGTAGGTCAPSADATATLACVPGVIHADRLASSWSSDVCNTTPLSGYSLPQWSTSGSGQGYADLIALELLSYRNQNLSTDTLWMLLDGKWDGVGMNDAATGPDGSYSTYKLALYKLCARALGKTVSPMVDTMLIGAQGSNGGIRTNYNAGGTFVGDLTGSARETSLVVLAFLMPATEL